MIKKIIFQLLKIKDTMYKLSAILLLTIMSCTSTENKKEYNLPEKLSLTSKEKNQERVPVDIYKKRINAIKTNDHDKYNELIEQFEFNKFPIDEINLTELMIVKNCYNKAFYDMVTLYPYKKEYTLESENHLMFFLSIAKALGYRWGNRVEVFEKNIKLSDVKQPNFYFSLILNSGGSIRLLEIKDGFTVKSENFNELYEVGLKAIEQNNRVDYNDVIRRFNLSQFSHKGLGLAQLMLIKNNYNKAYYDLVLLYPFKNKKYEFSKSKNYLMFLLSMAKHLGHKWGGWTVIFGENIKFDNIKSPEVYLSLLIE